MLCHPRRSPWEWPSSQPLAAPPRRTFSAKTPPPPLPPKTYKRLPPRAASCPLHRQLDSSEALPLPPPQRFSQSPKRIAAAPLFVPAQRVVEPLPPRRHRTGSLRSHSPGSVCPGAPNCATCAAASADAVCDLASNQQHNRLSPKSVSALCNAALSAASKRRKSKRVDVGAGEDGDEVQLRRAREPASGTKSRRGGGHRVRSAATSLSPVPSLPRRGGVSTFVGDSQKSDIIPSDSRFVVNSKGGGAKFDWGGRSATVQQLSNSSTPPRLQSFASSAVCCPACSLEQNAKKKVALPAAAVSATLTNSTSSDNLPHKEQLLASRRSKTPPASLQSCLCAVNTLSESLQKSCCLCACTCASTALQSCTCAPAAASSAASVRVPLPKTFKNKLAKLFTRGIAVPSGGGGSAGMASAAPPQSLAPPDNVGNSVNPHIRAGRGNTTVAAVTSCSRRERSLECMGRRSRNKELPPRHRRTNFRSEEAAGSEVELLQDAHNRHHHHHKEPSCPIPSAVSAGALPGNKPQLPPTHRSQAGCNNTNATHLASFTANMKMLKKVRLEVFTLVRCWQNRLVQLALNLYARCDTLRALSATAVCQVTFLSAPLHSSTGEIVFIAHADDANALPRNAVTFES